MQKKYYWLKLKEDFFRQKEIKKLRKIAGGDTYTIIYFKMQLLSLKNEGKLYFESLENNFYEEIALEIDEDTENVRITITFLLACGLLEEISESEYFLTKTLETIGKESTSAERVRKYRDRKTLQSNINVTQGNELVTICNTEIEIEIEKDIEIEKIASKDASSTNLLPILKVWNDAGLSQIKSINANTNRYKLLKARVKEYGELEVIRAIKNIKLSSFLKGQNDRGWTISFDWFIKPNNFMKVLEGNYTDKVGGKDNGATRTGEYPKLVNESDWDRREIEKAREFVEKRGVIDYSDIDF